jgi:hypothetical protein
MDVKRFGKFTEPGTPVTGDRTKRSSASAGVLHSIVDDCSSWRTQNCTTTSAPTRSPAFTTRRVDWFLSTASSPSD